MRVPSIGGTDGENEAQADMARRMADGGLDVDHWQIDLDDVRADPVGVDDRTLLQFDRRVAYDWGALTAARQ